MRNNSRIVEVRAARDCGNGMPEAFTLIELLIAMAIVGVLMGAIYGIFVSSNRSYHTQDRVTEAQQGLRVGLDFMVRDIRMAGFDPLGTVNAGFEVANATKLRFTSDTNMANGIEEIDRERITYEFDAVNKRLRQCLYEGTPSETWQTLIDNVNALAFTYLDANDSVTGTLADITTVLISMTCEGTNVQGQTFLRTLNTRVRCRNL
jgi:type IV pilus assembly protein PilW